MQGSGSSDFSDVFVSYRRKDVEFTKEIVNALRDAGKEVWIDWEDIPPGSVGFADDIKRGLEGADSFICILSPAYLESTYCVDMELGYALQLKKRIVPIVLHKFDGYDVPEGIAAINWVYFTPHAGHENPFEESFPKVLRALDQDLEHARNHKRLQIRALEWDAQARKESYLLIGDEITRAEAWISNAADKTPIPTELHANYITASRAQATKRQRQLMAGVSAALVISVVLGALAFWQMVVAEAARDAETAARIVAERNAQLSRSTSLALGAQEVNNFDQIDALTLALNAVTINQPPALSERTLATLAYQPGPIALLSEHSTRVRSLAYSHDGAWFVSGAEDRTLLIWDATTYEQRHTLNGHEREVSGVAVSPDDTQIASVGRDAKIILWDATNGEPLHILDAESRALAVAYSPDGAYLATTTEGGHITLRDAANGEPLRAFEGVSEAVFAVAFSADSAQLITGDRSGEVRVWDVESGENLLTLNAHTDTVLDVAVSSNGAWIGSASADRTAIIWDATSGERISTLLAHTNGVRSIAFSPDNASVLTASDDQTAMLWSTFNWQLQNTFNAHSGFLRDAVFHPDGLQFISGDTDGQIIVWSTLAGNIVAQSVTHEGTVNRVALSADGARVASAGDDGKVYVQDTATLAPIFTFEGHGARVNAVTFGTDENTLFSASEDLSVLGWSLPEGEISVRYSGHNVPVFDMVMLPNTDNIISVGGIVLSGGELHIWNTQNGESIAQMSEGVPPLYSVAISADGTQIATGTLDGKILLWDAATLTLLHTVNAHRGQVNQLSFDNTNDLFSASSDGAIRRWNIREQVHFGGEYGEHSGGVRGLVYVEIDGVPLLVSASEDDTLQISRVQDMQVIRTYSAHIGDVRTLAVRGDVIASGGVDGRVIVWRYQPLAEVVRWTNQARMVRTVDCTIRNSALIQNLLCR